MKSFFLSVSILLFCASALTQTNSLSQARLVKIGDNYLICGFENNGFTILQYDRNLTYQKSEHANIEGAYFSYFIPSNSGYEIMLNKKNNYYLGNYSVNDKLNVKEAKVTEKMLNIQISIGEDDEDEGQPMSKQTLDYPLVEDIWFGGQASWRPEKVINDSFIFDMQLANAMINDMRTHDELDKEKPSSRAKFTSKLRRKARIKTEKVPGFKTEKEIPLSNVKGCVNAYDIRLIGKKYVMLLVSTSKVKYAGKPCAEYMFLYDYSTLEQIFCVNISEVGKSIRGYVSCVHYDEKKNEFILAGNILDTSRVKDFKMKNNYSPNGYYFRKIDYTGKTSALTTGYFDNFPENFNGENIYYRFRYIKSLNENIHRFVAENDFVKIGGGGALATSTGTDQYDGKFELQVAGFSLFEINKDNLTISNKKNMIIKEVENGQLVDFSHKMSKTEKHFFYKFEEPTQSDFRILEFLTGKSLHQLFSSFQGMNDKSEMLYQTGNSFVLYNWETGNFNAVADAEIENYIFSKQFVNTIVTDSGKIVLFLPSKTNFRLIEVN